MCLKQKAHYRVKDMRAMMTLRPLKIILSLIGDNSDLIHALRFYLCGGVFCFLHVVRFILAMATWRGLSRLLILRECLLVYGFYIMCFLYDFCGCWIMLIYLWMFLTARFLGLFRT